MSKHEAYFTMLLDRYPAHEEHEDRWGESRLRVSEHLAGELPPDALITSVRAVVLVADQVLVVHRCCAFSLATAWADHAPFDIHSKRRPRVTVWGAKPSRS